MHTIFHQKLLYIILVIFFIPSLALALDNGERDPLFTLPVPPDLGTPQTYVDTILVQTDEDILISGVFEDFDGQSNLDFIARLNADGTRDTSFNPTVFPGSGFGASIEAVKLHNDGKIVVGGAFENYDSQANLDYIARLNSNGARDTGFNPVAFPAALFDVPVQSLAIQTNNKILVGGEFENYDGQANLDRIARLNDDGTRDTLFNPVAFNSTVSAIAIQDDGKIIVGGSFTNYDGQANLDRIARLNDDGTRDTSFVPVSFGSSVVSLYIEDDDQILVGGGFTNYDGQANLDYIARLNTNGTRDTSFVPVSFNNAVTSIQTQAVDEYIVVGGVFTNYDSQANLDHIARLNDDGTRDIWFQPTAEFDANTSAITVQPDDNYILVGGRFADYDSQSNLDHIVRLAYVPVTTIVSVSSPLSNGTYGAGTVIPITVEFSDVVTVTGVPTLTLETGTVDQSAYYSSGSGTDTLTFNYTVSVGDATTDLDYTNSSALSLNGGVIMNGEFAAVLTLPAPGVSNSLGNNKDIVVDGLGVIGVDTVMSDGTYGSGNTITVDVQFSDIITITGTPTLMLELGSSDGVAQYTLGSGTNTATFSYTIITGNSSSDLDYTSASALALNGGTIRSALNTDALLTLPSPGAVGSLSSNAVIVVSTPRSSSGGGSSAPLRDFCSNLPGVQSVVPAGYIAVGKQCVLSNISDTPALPLQDADGNGDGVIDGNQSHVRTVPNSLLRGVPVTIESIGTESSITQLLVETELGQSITDDRYQYPFGLLRYSATTKPGTSATFTIFMPMTIDPALIQIRKLTSAGYVDARTSLNATVTNTTYTRGVNRGKPVTKITYTITDGSQYDADGVANGVIVDPIGVGVLNAFVDRVTNTIINPAIASYNRLGTGQTRTVTALTRVVDFASVRGLSVPTAYASPSIPAPTVLTVRDIFCTTLPVSARPSAPRESILQVQRFLNILPNVDLTENGIYTVKTRAEVKHLQRQFGFPRTGIWDTRLHQRILTELGCTATTGL